MDLEQEPVSDQKQVPEPDPEPEPEPDQKWKIEPIIELEPLLEFINKIPEQKQKFRIEPIVEWINTSTQEISKIPIDFIFKQQKPEPEQKSEQKPEQKQKIESIYNFNNWMDLSINPDDLSIIILLMILFFGFFVGGWMTGMFLREVVLTDTTKDIILYFGLYLFCNYYTQTLNIFQ